MNSSHAILTGGFNINAKQTMIVDIPKFSTWTVGPEMITPRFSHSCTNFQNPTGTNYIIVAGGEDEVNGQNLDSVEILQVDINDGVWVPGISFKNFLNIM